jgi:hypothetical protein
MNERSERMSTRKRKNYRRLRKELKVTEKANTKHIYSICDDIIGFQINSTLWFNVYEGK